MDPDRQDNSTRSKLRRFLRSALPAACIVVAAVAIYSNSFACPFTFDDEDSIVKNPTIRNLGNLGEVLCPPHKGFTVEGRPVVNLSLAVNYAISGLDTWSYHAVNLAIHILAALTLYGLAGRTLRLEGMPDWLRRSGGSVAFAIAMIWAVHPIQTESVTYIIQRAESLMGLFYLATLYFFIRGATGAKIWFTAAIASCALGMASKEVMASAPVVVLFFDMAFLAGSFREALRRRWPIHACLTATWAILAVLLAGSFDRGGSAGLGMGVSPLDYALTQCKIVCQYIWLCFWPHPLVLDYNTPIISDRLAAMPYIAIVLFLLAAGVWALVRRPRIGLLALAFFAVLAPTSSFIPVKDSQFEHRMYLPLAAVAAMAVLTAQTICIRLGRLRPNRAMLVMFGAWAIFIIAAGALCMATYARNIDYRSAISIWQATVDARPENDRAWYNLGRAWQDAKNPQKALWALDRAVELKPDAVSLSTRANVLRQVGRTDDAMKDYAAAIALAPRYADVYYNRGNAYYFARKFDLALADYNMAVELRDDFFEAYMNRGLLLTLMNRRNEAIKDFKTAILHAPSTESAERAKKILSIYLSAGSNAATRP